MIIEISELIRHKSFTKKISFSYEKDKVFYEGEEIKFTKPIQVQGEISSSGDIINLDLVVKTELGLTCSRCLERFIYPFASEVNEKFTLNSEIEDEDVIILEGDKLDVTEFVENNIIMTLPIKKLCSESCKGLCQRCGTNLNMGNCNCDNHDVDPRLAMLKDLFLAD